MLIELKHRVSTHLENLEKSLGISKWSGKMKKVREKSGETEISVMAEGKQDTLSGDCRVQEKLLEVGAESWTPLRELTALH